MKYLNCIFFSLLFISCGIFRNGNCCDKYYTDEVETVVDWPSELDRVVMTLIEDTLNQTLAEFISGCYDRPFSVQADLTLDQFGMIDLVDTTNRYFLSDEVNTVRIKPNHIYHFYANKDTYSFSYIAFVEEAKVHIFEAINCRDRGDSLEDVLSLMSAKKSVIPNYEMTKEKVVNYRKYMRIYHKCNMASLQCDCSPCLWNASSVANSNSDL